MNNKYAPTKRQQEILELYDKLGSQKLVADELGISHGTVSKAIARVKRKAKMLDADIPDDQIISSVSTLYNKDQEVVLQWVKTKVDEDLLKEKIDIFINALSQDIRGSSKKTKKKKNKKIKDEIAVFPIGDLHLGMYSWIEETGNDYDCDIAESLVISAIDKLIDETSPREEAVIISLGDWFHSDTVDNKTLGHGNILDVDTRWQRVFRIGVRILKYITEKSLTKFDKVRIFLINGNHDYHTSYALSLIMDAYYENNNRVIVDLGTNPFRYFRYGVNLIGMTHGMIKESSLPGVMAADRPMDWGETVFRTWYIGHKHQHKLSEYPGCIVEIFPTLAGKDAWTNSMGYRSKREMHRIILHKKYGEVGRSIVNIGMIE